MPIFPLFFLYMIAEIYACNAFWNAYGFVNLFFVFLLSFFLGLGLVRSQGRALIMQFQGSLARSEMPSDQVLHRMLIFLGGLMLMVPGLVSDVLALILILPGTRHLLLSISRRRFKQKVASGGFQVFTFGSGGSGWAGGFAGRSNSQPFGSPRAIDPEDGWTRDVSPRVIDVTPTKPDGRED